MFHKKNVSSIMICDIKLSFLSLSSNERITKYQERKHNSVAMRDTVMAGDSLSVKVVIRDSLH